MAATGTKQPEVEAAFREAINAAKHQSVPWFTPIEIPAPNYINIEVKGRNGESIVVPTSHVAQSRCASNDVDAKDGFGESDACFAMTYYKIQGATVDKIVLDLNCRSSAKVNLQYLYVGITRLTDPNNLYIIGDTSGESIDVSKSKLFTDKLVQKLQQSPSLQEWIRNKLPLTPTGKGKGSRKTSRTNLEDEFIRDRRRKPPRRP